jgi:hypothetical protein
MLDVRSAPALQPAAPPRRPYVITLLVLFVAVAAAAVTTAGALRTPQPLPSGAPAEEFSAVRARAALGGTVATPHPVGSAANGRVREHLAGVLSGLGLSPVVRAGTAVADDGDGSGAAAGPVSNIEVTVPGRASTGRILIVAHYDSVPTGPGASDDGLGVATALETLRAITRSPALRNDVTVLFTDGEEAGLLGARHFTATAAAPVPPTVVLNLEARGTSGRAVMFETGPHNGALVPALRGHVPVVTSVSDEVYRLLPNSTDFTEFRRIGLTGLNFAVIGGSANYHTAQDNPANLDEGSLQDLGSSVLAATVRLGGADLATVDRESDVTYFALGPVLIRYPAAAVLPLAGLTLAGVAGALWLGRRRRIVGWRGVAVTAVSLPVPLIAAALTGFGGWALVRLLRPDYTGFVFGSPYRPGLIAAGLTVLTLPALWLWVLLLRRRFEPAELTAGLTTAFAALAAGAAILLPGGSYLFVWPALAGAAGLVVAALVPERSLWRSVTPALVAVPAAVLLAPLAALLFDTVGLALAAAPLLVVMLAAAALPGPATARLPGRRAVATATAAAVVVGAGLVGAGLLRDRVDAAHPAQVNLLYVLDADAGSASWATNGEGRAPWFETYRRGDTAPLAGTYPMLNDPPEWSVTPAPVAGVAVPLVTVDERTSGGGSRTFRLRVSANGGNPDEIRLYLDTGGGELVAASIGTHQFRSGVNLAPDAAPWTWGLTLVAPSPAGTEVSLTVRGDAAPRLRVVASSAGLPESALHEPPPRTVTWAAGSGVSFAARLYRL